MVENLQFRGKMFDKVPFFVGKVNKVTHTEDGEFTLCLGLLSNKASYLLSVIGGLPPPQEVQGLTVCVQRVGGALALYFETDRRGQVALPVLPEGEYQISVFQKN